MAGKFELDQDQGSRFRLRPKASGPRGIAVGEANESRSAAGNGIASLQGNAPGAPVVEVDG